MWWYLSFSDERWLGACFVQGTTELEAIGEAHRRMINPGGQVLPVSVPVDLELNILRDSRNKLFTTKEELERAIGPVVSIHV